MNIRDELAAGADFIRGLPDVADFAPIGSALYIESPADVDYAVMLSAPNAVDYANAICASNSGWEACGEYDTHDGSWCAIRRGNLNLMLTHSREFFDGYKLAMEVCKLLRLTDKQDRIDVCRVVRDRQPADVVRPALINIGWQA